MPSVTLTHTVAIAGVTITQQQAHTADGAIGYETQPTNLIPAAKTGSLTTRTDNTNGVVTAQAGHGLVTSDKVDVFWVGGRRYGVTCTVSGNAVTLSGGAGDNLPVATTAVTLSKRRLVNLGFDGDALLMLIAGNDRRCNADFQAANGTSLLSVLMTPGEGYGGVSGVNGTNPLAATLVAQVLVGNADSTNPLIFKVGVIYDTGVN